MKIQSILAIGDCNTLGAGELQGSCYPELLAAELGAKVENHAFTMSTTREGHHLLEDKLSKYHDCVIIQFGLVDSYETFRYAPYVLYYPDNPLRKQYRSLVKKIKKTGRKLGLHKRLGKVEVVPLAEYAANLETMIRFCGDRRIILPETVPHHENQRNAAIRMYNAIVAEVAKNSEMAVCIPLYELFAANMESLYMDATHINAEGQKMIVERVLAEL